MGLGTCRRFRTASLMLWNTMRSLRIRGDTSEIGGVTSEKRYRKTKGRISDAAFCLVTMRLDHKGGRCSARDSVCPKIETDIDYLTFASISRDAIRFLGKPRIDIGPVLAHRIPILRLIEWRR